jgi:hypothetical protein
VEWAFYESIGRSAPAKTSLTFLYDDWDRLPYECPFGSFPHDLAVRLFYLGRPACWHQGIAALRDGSHAAKCKLGEPVENGNATASSGHNDADLLVVGRARDLPELERLGHVETLARGPTIRTDRIYSLFRVSNVTQVARSQHTVGDVPAEVNSMSR